MKTPARHPVALLFCFPALLLFCSPALPQTQPTLDDLLNLPPPPPESPEAPPESPQTPEDPPAPAEPNEAVQQRLDGEAMTDAFQAAVADMALVADRLDPPEPVPGDPGLDTQRMQESILARLDQIIEAAEQQQSSSSSSSSSSSGQNQDSQAQNAGQQPQPGTAEGQAQNHQSNRSNDGAFSPGQVGPVAPNESALDEVRSEWGDLPPRLRDELSNGLDEPYSPVYRRLTEAYYRRLAEEAE
jgi:hypothetical protein